MMPTKVKALDLTVERESLAHGGLGERTIPGSVPTELRVVHTGLLKPHT